ncbi:NAD(P)H-dependent oxidoreductase [Paenibacillus sp. ACRSA]|uniref:NAD(P)H-dependent oxidoreductase n=1 Tax=Paenibacillus sp. ACRSA TaxID=2918211 RepID=UPI001EF575B9|nr:NAD(P)H-dependent oxidoreductase [Paenibacillus sp. ACRSA]MCG7378713.1 NAD(P)H-dependent oxidoreductase [Paenibacillus sp. ACRSA]
MSTLLYITAHPLTEEQSYGLATGKAFVETYQEVNPNDEVIHINLYQDNIPMIDADVFSGWGKLGAGTSFDQLTEQEQSKVARLGEISDQFAAADKYVFVTPFWNLSYPPMMKAYFDAVSVAGKAFKYIEGRPVGLLTDKKALHIQARGGVFSEAPASEFEMGHRHMQVMMKFFGVPSFEHIVLEGLAKSHLNANEIKENAIQRAKDLAHTF